ncbi:MAG: hypothetical protein HYV32_03485 [Candidatus Kerfeldbacteria bacterium]|nr:hypothetical protein [Candidatus Kerfeldbacteria bacterium]
MEKELFSTLGFNEQEQAVFLAVQQTGKISPARVAKLTGINRTTVYSIGKKLIQLGLITEDIGNKVRYLVAGNPKALLDLVTKEEQQIKKKKEAAQILSRNITTIMSAVEYSVPKIKVIEESDLTTYLHKQYEHWKESGEAIDNTWWGFHDSSFTEHYGRWIDWTWQQGPKDLKVRFLTNDKNIERAMREKYVQRLVKPTRKGEFDASLWVIGDYIIMVKTRDRPHYMVEIHDAVLARNLRELFKNMWEK